jgi:hypothetical protein
MAPTPQTTGTELESSSEVLFSNSNEMRPHAKPMPDDIIVRMPSWQQINTQE